jgi:hypothetical protein
MKKALLLFTMLMYLFANVHAQTYGEKAKMFDTHLYISQDGDPYSPIWSGIASCIIPGAGQMICDETVRGLSFLGGYIGCAVLFVYGGAETVEQMLLVNSEPFIPRIISYRGPVKMALGLVGMAGIGLWSVIDAVHVAKVNNMFSQSQFHHTGSVNLKIEPYAESISLCNQVTVPVGLSLKATF